MTRKEIDTETGELANLLVDKAIARTSSLPSDARNLIIPRALCMFLATYYTSMETRPLTIEEEEKVIGVLSRCLRQEFQIIRLAKERGPL